MSSPDAPTHPTPRLTLGRAVVDDSGPHDALVLVSWLWDTPTPPPHRVQVYVNQTLVDVSDPDGPTERWLILDRQQPQVIELLAIDADDPAAAWIARPDRLTAYGGDRVHLPTAAVIRDEAWPIDTRLRLEVDGRPVAAGPLWPDDRARGGFGGLFGIGGFGTDAAAGPGLGQGELGFGPLGHDGTAWRCTPPPLPPGLHAMSLSAVDADGQPLADPLALPAVATRHPPSPPRDLHLDTDFTLTWTA